MNSHLPTPRRVAVALLLGALASGPAGAWVDTKTQAMPLTRLVATGALPAATPLKIVVGLRERNVAALDAFLQRITDPESTDYGRLMPEAQYDANHAPTIAQARTVTEYLVAQGFRSVEVGPGRMLVTAEGTAEIVQRAFNTSLALFDVGGRAVFTNLSPAQVPDHLADVVLNVSGLHSIDELRTQAAVPDPLKSTLGYNPHQLAKAYNAHTMSWGNGTRVGVFMAGPTPPVVNSLAFYRSKFGLPGVPVTKWVQNNVEPTDNRNLKEWAMDTQTSTGIAGNVAELRLYVAATMGTPDLAVTMSQFADEPGIKALSASIGICEILPFLSGDMALIDNAFRKGVVLYGKTVFAASGDAGSACSVVRNLGLPMSGPPSQVYPATSPWVVAVGGTTLLVGKDGTYSQEIAWSSSGGGYSYVETAPDWQKGKVPMKVVGRGVPDISLVGDPNTGAIVYTGQTENVIGGTSLSAPLALGVWARLQTVRGNSLGFAAPAFYRLETALQEIPLSPKPYHNGFHDIVAGCNGLYCTMPKWDFVTGIGTPHVQLLNGFIR